MTWTSIPVKADFRDKLRKEGRKDETWQDLLERILREAKRRS